VEEEVEEARDETSSHDEEEAPAIGAINQFCSDAVRKKETIAMADGISISVEGLSDLQSKLTELSTKQADAAIRKALKAGAEIERAAISERAPIKDTTGGSLPDGALANDTVVKIKRSQQGNLYAVVGPDTYTAHVARWVEYGHRGVEGGRSQLLANGKTKGPGTHTHDVPEHPFIRPAFESTRLEVVDAMCQTLADEISLAAQRNK
jgi:HK97 gp10 family phage protein